VDHPIALVLVAAIQIIIAHIEKLFDVFGKFIEKGIAVPNFIENHQRKLVWA
jgi:hypothetical protein